MMLVPAATLAREKNVTSTKEEGAPYNQDIMRRLSSTVMQRALEDSVQNLPVGATAVAKVAAGACLLIPAGTLAWELAVGEQSIALRIPLPMLGGGGMPDITNWVTGGDEKETAERMIFETNLRPLAYDLFIYLFILFLLGGGLSAHRALVEGWCF